MAQLPPKVPNMMPNWADFPHQKLLAPIEILGGNISTNHNQSSWVDEFLDFSSAKRGSHRRSISDSIAFLEVPLVEECRRSSIPGGGGGGAGTGTTTASEFDKFDDEQLMSMFTDEIANSGGQNSNPSSPSDHNSINDDKQNPDLQMQQQMMKTEPDEVESSCKSDLQFAACAAQNGTSDISNEKIFDPKRIKRY